MKKVSLILAALALVLGISQCKKQEEPAASGEKQHIVLNASFGGGNSKIADNGTGGLIWSLNDVIKVSNIGGELGELHCTDAANGTFEGEISESSGTITFKFGSQLNAATYLFQTGELKDAIYLKGEANYQSSGNYDVTMDMPHAVVKLDLSEFLVSGEQNVLFKNDGGGAVAGLEIGDDFEEPCYVAIPSGNIVAVFGDKSGTSAVNWSLEPNSFYTAAGEGGAPTGKAIVIEPATPTTPKFTVGMDGDKPITVEFSKGNLWYGTEDGAKPQEKAFHFEKNQWDTDPTAEGQWDESHVSHFFWSNTTDWQTSGKEPYAESYSYNTQTTGDVFFTNSQSFQVSGETADTWRTLSKAEWNYLLSNRASVSSLCARVTLTDVNVYGLVILPDGSTVTASSVTTTTLVATSGAVFLPAAGYRSGTDVGNAGSGGYYWSSTPYEDYEDGAYYMYFDSDYVNTYMDERSYGYAVRLVRDIK